MNQELHNIKINLKKLGWNNHFEDCFNKIDKDGVFPARVATAQREIYSVISESGEHRAELSGKIRYKASSASDFPVVGDWIIGRLSDDGSLVIIENILPRLNKLSRKVPGDITDEQVLVANIDIVFIVNGLDNDFNLRRIERYIATACNNSVKPVILLNKADLCDNAQEKIEEVKRIALGSPVHVLSALSKNGIENLFSYIHEGTTIAFLGSSGVGKSTLINCLLGENRLKTGAVRHGDDKGKHVTTHRELIVLPDGGIVIDNPGLRELQLWLDKKDLDNTFNDVAEIADKCRFKDCKHENEPGCAVKNAIENGELNAKRFRNYVKLGKEAQHLATRKEVKSKNTKIIWEKNISKLSKAIQKNKNKYV